MWVFFKYPKISKIGNPLFFSVVSYSVGEVWIWTNLGSFIKQLLDDVEHDIMNHQNRGLCYLLKPKAEADNTDTRF